MLAPATVTLANGVRLSYVERGSRGAPTVVLLHGLADSWRSFASVLPHMPETLRSLAVSQRGHGDSDKPRDGYRIGDFASDLAAFLDAVGAGRSIVVGHSSHGLVAQRLAIDRPDKVAGIVLVSAFATLKGNAAAEAFVASTVPTLRDPIDPDFIRAFQQGTFVRTVPESFLGAMVADSLKVPARVWRAAFEGLLREDFTAELPAIAAPALLVWGDRDAIVGRREQDRLVAGLPEAELIVYEGVGHSPHWEEPARFAADLAEFVERSGG